MEKRENKYSIRNEIDVETPFFNDNFNDSCLEDAHSKDKDGSKRTIVTFTLGSTYNNGNSAKLQNIWYLNMQRALLNSFSKNMDSKQPAFRCDILTNAQGFAIDISSRSELIHHEKGVLNHGTNNFNLRDNSQLLGAVYCGLCHTTHVNLPVILYNHKNALMQHFQDIEEEYNCHITVEIRDKEKIQFYSKAHHFIENPDLGTRKCVENTDQTEDPEKRSTNKLDIVITGLANEVGFSRLKIIKLIESYFNKELQYCQNEQLFYPDMLKNHNEHLNIKLKNNIPKEKHKTPRTKPIYIDTIDESAKSVLNTIYYSTFVNTPLCLYSHWQPLPFFYRKTIWVDTYKLFFIFVFLKEQLEEILAKMECCLVVGNIDDDSSELRIFTKVLKSGRRHPSEDSIEEDSDFILRDDDFKRESRLLNSLLSQIMSLFESVLKLTIPSSFENKKNDERLYQFCFLGLNHISLTKKKETICFLHRDNISTALNKISEYQTLNDGILDPSNAQPGGAMLNQKYGDDISLQLVLNHSLTDFLCGKKNGKINRIIKETNVRIVVQHRKETFYLHQKSYNQGYSKNTQQYHNVSRRQHDSNLSNQSSDKKNFTDQSKKVLSNDHLDANASIVTLFTNSATDLKAALDLLLLEFPSSLTFFLPEKYHKRIIGFGGKNIQRIMKKHGVYIKFFSEWEQNQTILRNNFCRYGVRYIRERERREYSIEKEPLSFETKAPFESEQPQPGNVVIKTPKKNSKSLILMKKEILSLVDEEHIEQSSQVYKMHPFEYFRFTHSQGNIRIGWNEVVFENVKLWIESGGQFISYKPCDFDIVTENRSHSDTVVSNQRPLPYDDSDAKDTTSEQHLSCKMISFDTEQELEQSIEEKNRVIEQILPENQHITTQIDNSTKKSGKLDYISDDLTEDENLDSENKDISLLDQDIVLDNSLKNPNSDCLETNMYEKNSIADKVGPKHTISDETPQIIIKNHRHIFSKQLKSRQIIYQLVLNDQDVDLSNENNIKWVFPIYYEIKDQTRGIGHQLNLSDGTRFIRSLFGHENVHQVVDTADPSIQNNVCPAQLKRHEITAMSWRSTDLSVFPSKLFSIYEQNEKIDKKQSWWCVGTGFDTIRKRDKQK